MRFQGGRIAVTATSRTKDREALVELVNDKGVATGSLAKLAAHVAPGRLHRAFSIFLLDSEGRLVLQRRAASKYHTPGLWSNTCCGHPAPGHDPRAEASRRLLQELGLYLQPQELTTAGSTTYSVTDRISGLVECEFDHLYVGVLRGTVDPDPAEVADVRALPIGELALLVDASADFTPWFSAVLKAARPALEQLARSVTGRQP